MPSGLTPESNRLRAALVVRTQIQASLPMLGHVQLRRRHREQSDSAIDTEVSDSQEQKRRRLSGSGSVTNKLLRIKIRTRQEQSCLLRAVQKELDDWSETLDTPDPRIERLRQEVQQLQQLLQRLLTVNTSIRDDLINVEGGSTQECDAVANTQGLQLAEALRALETQLGA